MTQATKLKTTITVRDCRPEDAAVVRDVQASATVTLRQTYRPNARALRHKRSLSHELRRLVAECNGSVVGTAQYFVDGNTMRIIGLGVHSDFRRRGVARALVAEIRRRAGLCGLPRVVTRTVEQTGNVPIFEALGFEPTASCRDDYSESLAGGDLTDVSLEMPVNDGSRTR
jgi:GNAT superfamily N-acetyltransferase